MILNIFYFYSFSKNDGFVTKRTPTYPDKTQITWVFENISSVLKNAISDMITGNNINKGIHILYGKLYRQYCAQAY